MDRETLLIAWQSDKVYKIIKEQATDFIGRVLDVVKERIGLESIKK